jgi:hypothetical protein
VPNGPILAAGIEALQNNQKGMFFFSVEQALDFVEPTEDLLELAFSLVVLAVPRHIVRVRSGEFDTTSRAYSIAPREIHSLPPIYNILTDAGPSSV